MKPVLCQNCGDVIVNSGLNYKGEARWVHKRTGSIQCQLFARPPEEPKP